MSFLCYYRVLYGVRVRGDFKCLGIRSIERGMGIQAGIVESAPPPYARKNMVYRGGCSNNVDNVDKMWITLRVLKMVLIEGILSYALWGTF